MLGSDLGNKSKMPQNYLRQLAKALKKEFNMQGSVMKIHLRTTCMPKPRSKMGRKELLKWKRLGPKQAEAAMARYRKRKSSGKHRDSGMDGGGLGGGGGKGREHD